MTQISGRPFSPACLSAAGGAPADGRAGHERAGGSDGPGPRSTPDYYGERVLPVPPMPALPQAKGTLDVCRRGCWCQRLRGVAVQVPLRAPSTSGAPLPSPFPARSPALGDKGEKLRAAARKGQTKTIKDLLLGPQPPPIDARDRFTKRTPLMEAAQHGHAGVVWELVARGADVNALDAQGFTALMHAARSGSICAFKTFGTVQALFSQREKNSLLPTLDAQSAQGWTALMYAASINHKRMVQSLLSRNAKRDTRNNQGKTAWELTTCYEIKAVLAVGQDEHTQCTYPEVVMTPHPHLEVACAK
jgi:uncharacterized protein